MRYRPSCILVSLALIAGCAVGTSESGVDDGRGPDAADAGARDATADGTAGDASSDDDDASARDADREGAADDAGRDAPVDNGSLDAGREASSGGGADASCTATIVLNELRVESASSGLDQFIELYNPAACAVDLAGYRVASRAGNGTIETAVWAGAAGKSIAARGYFVLAGNDFSGARDAPIASVLFARSGGGLGLYVGSQLADSLGWGSATNAFVESSPAVAPTLAQSLARRPNGGDSNNNFSDFVATSAQTPGAAN